MPETAEFYKKVAEVFGPGVKVIHAHEGEHKLSLHGNRVVLTSGHEQYDIANYPPTVLPKAPKFVPKKRGLGKIKERPFSKRYGGKT